MILLAGATAGMPAARAADPVKIAIVFTSHRTYRDTAVSLETAAKEKKWSYGLVELRTGASDPGQADANPDATRNPAPGTAASKPASSSDTDQEARKRLVQIAPTIIVAVGPEATTLALEAVPKVPVVFCMVPNALDARFLAEDNKQKARVAGVAADVSPTEQITWALKLHEEVKNIGVFYSSRTRRTVEALRAAGRDRGVTITLIETSKNDFLQAIDLLSSNRCDGVIMVPDAEVYNTPAVQRLLLWGLRVRKPVWGFSSKVVKAGAFAGWQPADDSIRRQTIDLVEKIINGTQVSTIGVTYASKITCAINERSAEMIGVSLPDEILNQMTERFGGNE
jgi:putative tryptophan/tyrosine transport system substrate-binding protein